MYNESYFYFSVFVCGLGKRKRILWYPFPILYHEIEKRKDGIYTDQPHDCLLNRLFKRRSKKTSKLRDPGLCAGNSPGSVNSPHKWPVTRKMFPFDDVIMINNRHVDSVVTTMSHELYFTTYIVLQTFKQSIFGPRSAIRWFSYCCWLYPLTAATLYDSMTLWFPHTM